MVRVPEIVGVGVDGPPRSKLGYVRPDHRWFPSPNGHLGFGFHLLPIPPISMKRPH